MKRRPKKCAFLKCYGLSSKFHRHHLTYEPEVKALLCRQHHEDITIINGVVARRLKRKLTNRERFRIWCDWQGGKVQANRRFSKNTKWIDRWRH